MIQSFCHLGSTGDSDSSMPVALAEVGSANGEGRQPRISAETHLAPRQGQSGRSCSAVCTPWTALVAVLLLLLCICLWYLRAHRENNGVLVKQFQAQPPPPQLTVHGNFGAFCMARLPGRFRSGVTVEVRGSLKDTPAAENHFCHQPPPRLLLARETDMSKPAWLSRGRPTLTRAWLLGPTWSQPQPMTHSCLLSSFGPGEVTVTSLNYSTELIFIILNCWF